MKTPRLRAPIILVHGLFGFDAVKVGSWMKIDYFNKVPQMLADSGNRVLVAKVSPTNGIAERAAELKAFLLKEMPNDPVHIFAHSMGGLDTRHMITHLGMAERVLSLTSIGTPHRGSPFADWALSFLVPFIAPVFDLVRLPRKAFRDLTVVHCKKFNDETPDDPRVRYFSVAGRFTNCWYNPSWQLSAPIVERAEGPSDGVVSLASAKWGESFEVWDGDHFNLANWPTVGVPSEKCNRLADYARLVERLEGEGF